ncbi:MAG: hypothetical protein COW84_03960 [Gammaproteobacteria bacterium CG22_combo_CG10-13_8_21_14_all_40_8]|nr:MAG: hypothetical protein COW84_03960 [Gammaproteobacteria bacterium CG22_combo_CG10-13_8_21_14_all_40_8]
MKIKVLTWIGLPVLAVLIFIGGMYLGATLTYYANGASYTKEHVDNGRYYLYALKSLEVDKDTSKAISMLRNGLYAKIAIVGLQLDVPANNRDKDLIEAFYQETIAYLKDNGGLFDTYNEMIDGKKVAKPVPYSSLLQDFAKKNHIDIKEE